MILVDEWIESDRRRGSWCNDRRETKKRKESRQIWYDFLQCLVVKHEDSWREGRDRMERKTRGKVKRKGIQARDRPRVNTQTTERRTSGRTDREDNQSKSSREGIDETHDTRRYKRSSVHEEQRRRTEIRKRRRRKMEREERSKTMREKWVTDEKETQGNFEGLEGRNKNSCSPVTLCVNRKRRVITFTPQTIFMIHKIHLTLNLIHQKAKEKEREGSLSSFSLFFSSSPAEGLSCLTLYLILVLNPRSLFPLLPSLVLVSHPVSLFLLHISRSLPPLPFLVHSFLFSFTFLPLLVLRLILRERMREAKRRTKRMTDAL